jgi:hypothetical protein
VRIAGTGEVDLENTDVVDEQLPATINNQAASVLVDLADPRVRRQRPALPPVPPWPRT